MNTPLRKLVAVSLETPRPTRLSVLEDYRHKRRLVGVNTEAELFTELNSLIACTGNGGCLAHWKQLLTDIASDLENELTAGDPDPDALPWHIADSIESQRAGAV